MYININVINDNVWRFQNPILLFKISMNMRGEFEINSQFGHAPSERFATSVLGTVWR